jgi:hypothetical protein
LGGEAHLVTRRGVLHSFGLATCALPLAVIAQQVNSPLPRLDDDLISNLEGKWLLTRQIRGTQVQNRLTATWVLNHQFLQVHMRDTREPPTYEALVLIGHAERGYVAHWADTFGGRASAIGTGVRSQNTIEFRFEYSNGPFFNTLIWNPETKQWRFRLESQDQNGQRHLFALDSLVREQ